MNTDTLLLTQPIGPPTALHQRDITNAQNLLTALKTTGTSDAAKIKATKDFESILIHRLLDQMSKTTRLDEPQSGTGQQIHGLFWLYLAKHLADNGGLGFWKDIYQSVNQQNTLNKPVKQSLETNL